MKRILARVGSGEAPRDTKGSPIAGLHGVCAFWKGDIAACSYTVAGPANGLPGLADLFWFSLQILNWRGSEASWMRKA